MNIPAKLAFSYSLRHPARTALTALAVVAASSIVVWVVSGYDALTTQFDQFSGEYLGRYHLMLVPAETDSSSAARFEETTLSDDLIAELRGDPAVIAVDPGSQTHVTATRLGGNRPESDGRSSRNFGRPMGPPLIGTTALASPYPLAEGVWIDPRSSRNEAAVSRGIADRMGWRLGDEIDVRLERPTTETGPERDAVRLKIVGLVDQPSHLEIGRGSAGPSQGPASSAIYVSIAISEAVAGRPANVTFAGVKLREDARAGEFRNQWSDRLAEASPPAMLLNSSDIENELSQGRSAENIRQQAYAATGISLLAALFIIFTALGMGVHERTRQFGVLRAVGLTRLQIAKVVAIESLTLAMIGWAGGLAAGTALIVVLTASQSGQSSSGAMLGMQSIVLSGLCAFGGSLAAAIFPAWRATRVSPLEAMRPRPISTGGRWFIAAFALGVALVAVNPLLVYVMPMADEARYGILTAIGYGTMAIGFVLLAPLAVLVAERLFGPILARLLRLEPRLLASQLSSHLGRTLGTTVALTLGLGLFVAMQTWGYSMLKPFEPGDWVPDMIVTFTTGGLPDSEFDAVRGIPGVNADRCLPLAVEQAQLTHDLTGSSARRSVTRQDNVILIGLDPNKGLGGSDPLLGLNFVRGNRDEAVAAMRSGRAVVVPEHFARETGLTVSDTFRVIPPESPEARVAYTIAGTVELPGWHWMTKFSGLRRRDGRSAAMVFAPFDVVRSDFGLEKINYFWLDTDGTATLAEIGESLQPIAGRNPGEKQPINGQGTWKYAATNFGETVRISTRTGVQDQINERASGMIWAMCYLPLVTLAVTSIGVVNTVLASIRTRRWEFGVLRAVGLTRFALVRLVVAEALLVGAAACLLSFAFGVMAGWCGVGISQYVSFFGGMSPSLVIPWRQLALGFAGALSLCFAAALWPAVTTGRTEPLRLLQEGRSAT